MSMTADDLTVAILDDVMRLVSDAKGERDPVRYLWDRCLDLRSAITDLK